jgi:hypothetical protein
MIDTLPEQRIAQTRRQARRIADCSFDQLEARQIETMRLAFRDHGGILSGDTLVERLRPACAQPISKLAKWIVARSVLCLAWQGSNLVPMFQFQPCDLSIRTSFTRAFDELKDTFDNWEIGLWFATPNLWLDDRAPVDCLDESWIDVVQAARADRFIVRG